mgnify:CR=1 FL=1
MIEQAALAGSIVQAGPAGSVSVNLTFLAVPAPLFLALIVKPICSPALTVALSAFLVKATSGLRQATESLPVRVGWLDAVSVPVFG